jgi:hypothetical protein
MSVAVTQFRLKVFQALYDVLGLNCLPLGFQDCYEALAFTGRYLATGNSFDDETNGRRDLARRSDRRHVDADGSL